MTAATHPLGPLAETPQWVVVKLVPMPGNKTDKIPFNYLTRQPCNAHESPNWTTYDAARAIADHWLTGGERWTVGFVLTTNDDFFCIDVDHAFSPQTGWSALAQQIVRALPGCMAELSQSGTGLHVWGRYPSPPPHAKKRVDLGIEAYTELRFIAIGTNQTGTIAPRCDALPAFLAAWFPPKNTGAQNLPAEGPRADWRGPADDAELLRRALQSKTVAAKFGAATTASFADLWHADLEVLHRLYPGDGEGGVDRSSVDMALAQHLAFWTGCDQARMVSLMQQSKLVREKWEREDYLPRTVASACALQRDVLQDKPVVSPLAPTPPAPPATAPAAPLPPGPPAPAAPAAPAERDGATFIRPDQAAELFKGCVYVIDPHRVLVPGGRLLKPEQFKAVFGGYTFIMDATNTRTSRDAFEAFTQNQVFRPPEADGTCFKPRRQPGEIITMHGRRLVNTWDPPNVRRVKGDPGPFLRHLELLLPDAQDRAFLLYYLANLVQRPGEKFSWAPVIQGVEGNGKSFVSKCVRHALGDRYVYTPRADKITKDFNAWMAKRLAIVVDDIRLKNADLLEQLKPLITEGAVEIEGKGVDQEVIEVCANWLFNSNHRDGIRKTRNDRRYMVLWCAQQAADDLERCGMGPGYFSELHRWAEDQDGYAIVADHLATLPIPEEFGLRWVKGRAPKTSSTAEAIEANRTPAELAVLEAIDMGRPGFRGDWVSTVMMRKLLEEKRLLQDCREASWPILMEGLDYVPHPGLAPRGQVHNVVLPDGAKPKLYVRKGSSALGIQRPAEIARAYTAAQGVVAP